jgi:4-amino-4-deoxy-L-arabinose transferase-like glycosyltransferase
MTTAAAPDATRGARLRAWLRVPLTQMAIAVALVALVNGIAWSLVTPPFQVPDETAHFAYAQHLAETGKRAGEAGRPEFSSEQGQAMGAMATLTLIGRPFVHTPGEGPAERAADAQIRAAADHAPRDDGGGPSTASSQPALYYALVAIPYRLFSWATLPARLQAMRITSAIMFAIAAAACALFVAEVLPRQRWAPVVGGLAVALSPYTAFVSSGVTPDALLLTTSALTLLVVARAFTRGLTLRRAVALGLVVGAGMLTKLTYLTFVPPAAAAFLYLLWRDRARLARDGVSPWRVLAAGAGALLLLPVLFAIWTKATGMPLRATGAGTASRAADQIPASSLRTELSYAWQLYLPRLPFMTDQFGFWPPDGTWLQGFAGRYGWLDYGAPGWIVDVVRVVVVAGLVLLVAALVRFRAAVWRARALIVAMALFVLVLFAVIAHQGYDYRRATGFIFEQSRYLFPLAALFSAAVATACLGLGRRFAPYLAAIAVTLFCLHDLSGVLVTLARYYG